MPMNAAAMLGLVTRFHVTVDGVDLGGWARCSGLSVDFKPEVWYEGGNYQHPTYLPGQIEYPPITLQRAMNAQDTPRVQAWLSSKAQSWVNADSSGGGGTAQITLFDSKAQKVASWSLRNVYPSKWDGPELDARTLGVAIESLQLVHEGFL
ncbi:phage tail protein [Kutzneria kofuensis]|jgi:phage tail-like protein|uniref:Phage tail-like protein n=1 Tax=Kutzneria kofuensis TaxID=103725 RepID=A0A7W9KMJ3_9PSEU|nr:phage tail protein [Kutzneria kofuensis]MBB5895212.1 phage tail-like protein [Kutzneria kofuensis]